MLSETGWQNSITKFVVGFAIFSVGYLVGYYIAPAKEKVVTKTETKYVEVEGKTKT